MSDLISRKALVHSLIENYEECTTFDGLLKHISKQPTAYDVEKVVKQLESKIKAAEKVMVKNPHDALDKAANDTAESFIEAYKEAIETVKAGGEE